VRQSDGWVYHVVVTRNGTMVGGQQVAPGESRSRTANAAVRRVRATFHQRDKIPVIGNELMSLTLQPDECTIEPGGEQNGFGQPEWSGRGSRDRAGLDTGGVHTLTAQWQVGKSITVALNAVSANRSRRGGDGAGERELRCRARNAARAGMYAVGVSAMTKGQSASAGSRRRACA
jgi:hypothetical protein